MLSRSSPMVVSGAVAGDDRRFRPAGPALCCEGADDFLHGTAGEIGAADGSGEERVSGDQLFFGSEIEADAAFGVAGGVQHFGSERSGGTVSPVVERC